MVELSRRGKDVDLNALKSAACRKYGLSRAPKLVEMIAALPDSEREMLLPKLRAKPVRTASGTAVVADFEYSTQSYTGYEPTSMRAIRARYNPYVQAPSWIDQLKRLGHSVDKVEFILMGGTLCHCLQTTVITSYGIFMMFYQAIPLPMLKDLTQSKS
ncbi:hypothetical protein FXO38_31012 [Capsicum annuum]|nr:hypothetical protein FXO38_31012 [Capsicum annuum]